MKESKLSDEIVKLLRIMKFDKLTEIPSMRMLRKKFKKQAVEKYPNKGSSKEFPMKF